MKRLDVKINDEVLYRVQGYAAGQNTTIAALVANYLTTLAKRQSTDNAAVAAELQSLWHSQSRRVETRSWTRDELHER